MKLLESYIAAGWALTFAKSKEKNPGSLMGSGWQDRCAKTVEDARRWLDANPNANVGVLLGPESGIIDLEFDSEQGREIVDDLLSTDPGNPTPTYRSGKSIHRLYAYQDNLPPRTVLKYKGVEFRIGAGRAAQSILPPSLHPSGRRYEWLDGLSPQDVAVQPMPWPLLDLANYVAKLRIDEKAEIDEFGELYVPDGARHDWLVSAVAKLRDWGLSENQLRQVADVIDTEVVHFDATPDRDRRIDSIVNWAANNITPTKVDLPTPTYRSEATSAAALLEKTIEREFAVENMMVMNEPMIIGGPSKSLKTSVMLDLAVSLVTGTPFLGEFRVPASQPVMVISGESGEKTIQDNLRAIVVQRGLQSSDLSKLMVSYRLPKLDDAKHVEDLIVELKASGTRIVFIDPLYRSLRVGDAASNVYSMGEKLELIAEKVHRAGITPVLLHHFKKQGRTHDEAPELEDLSQAGIGEFGRQFLLLKRREVYAHDGNHTLWFQWGGSAGHQGQKILHAYSGTQETGLAWNTTLHKCQDWEDRKKEERSQQKEQRDAEALIERRVEILDHIAANPGCTRNAIESTVKGGSTFNRKVLEALIEAGEVETQDGPNRSRLHFLSNPEK